MQLICICTRPHPHCEVIEKVELIEMHRADLWRMNVSFWGAPISEIVESVQSIQV